LYDQYASLSDGTRVVFNGQDIDRVADDGTLLLHYGSTPTFVFTGFLRVDPSETFALIGESSNGDIFKITLSSPGISTLANVPFNFDAVFEDAGHVFVSAAPCSFGCGNAIVRLDVTNGATSICATVSGPSGPITKAPNGDVYYGLQDGGFPPPSGSGAVLVWTDAQLTSGIVQTEATATPFVTGLDAVSSLAIDAVYGHVFVADVSLIFSTDVTHVREFDAFGDLVENVVESDNNVTNLELFYGPGPGSLQSFQPANGVTMKLRATNWSASTSRVLTLRPKRPVATTSGPGLTGPGLVTLKVTGAVPNSTVHVISSPVGNYNPTESAHDMGNYLFVSGMPLNMIHHVATVHTNTAGTGTYTYSNPGNQQGTLVFQALIADAPAHYTGSSTAAFN
jgi:hypothetical protein